MIRAKKTEQRGISVWMPAASSLPMTAGWGLAGVVVGISGLMSVMYGFSLGEPSGMGLVFAVLAGGITGVKAMGLALTFGRGHRLAGLYVLPLVLMAFCYAVTAGHQFAAENLYRAANKVAGSNTAYETLRDSVEGMRKELLGIGEIRDVGAIKAEITGKTQHARWLSTKQCTEATVAESFTYCQEYSALQAGLALAEKRDRLKAELAAGVIKLQATPSSAGVAREAGPVAALIGRMTGYDFGSQAEFMAWLIVCFVEMGDIVLPLVMTMVAQPSVRRVREARQVEVEKAVTAQVVMDVTKTDKEIKRERDIAECQAYLNAWTTRDQNADIGATDFHGHYMAVCAAEGRVPLKRDVFGSVMGRELKLEKFKRNTWYYRSVRLKPLPEAKVARPKLRAVS